MYEEWGLIPQAERKSNGYRIFTDFHIEQLKLARIAFKILLDDKKKSPEMCLILDAPNVEKKAVAEYFCDNIILLSKP